MPKTKQPILALFSTGQLVATPGALEALEHVGAPAMWLVARHVSGDWGDMSKHDKDLNEEAVKTGDTRIFSAYELLGGLKVWVITEADRSSTTVLLPSEY